MVKAKLQTMRRGASIGAYLTLVTSCLPNGLSSITAPEDSDGDGFYAPRADCDDTDPAIHPGAEDTAGDGIDSDCGGNDAQDPHIGIGPKELWCSSLQNCLDLATDGTTVWVGSAHTYVESNLRFSGKRVRLAVVDPSQPTTIVGDANASVFCFVHDDGAVLDGFTIQNGTGEPFPANPCGTPTPEPDTRPEALEALDTPTPSPTPGIESPTPTAGPIGGGIYMAYSAVTISNCVIIGNGSGATHYGGGIAMIASAPIIANCKIVSNTAQAGAQVLVYTSQPLITNTTISGGQPTIPLLGGGLVVRGSTPTMKNCVVSGNTATQGGGLYVDSGANADEVPVYSTLTMQHCVIYGNTALTQGGGVFLAVDLQGQAAIRIEESILTGNQALEADASTNLYVNDTSRDDFSQIVHIRWSDLYDESTQDSGYLSTFVQSDECDPSNGPVTRSECNFVIDPRFADAVRGDFHLSLDSPLIDNGIAGSAHFDHDGSRSDVGCFGGASGFGWDQDFDQYYNYFWPGTYDDVPDGYIVQNYDCNDSTPEPDNSCQ